MAVTSNYETILVDIEDRICWLTFNRPQKRNAMNPTMHREIVDALKKIAVDEDSDILVLAGAGESWCAGQDLNEYFRQLEDKPLERDMAIGDSVEWRYRMIPNFSKPTIASVNGWCFGGAFTQLIGCDFAIAAEEAIFGLSEINFGGFPAGIVTKMVADALSYRDAMYYILTGDTFDGKRAAEIRLVNYAVPRAKLREETIALAKKLQAKNQYALRAAKQAYRHVRTMDIEQSREYLMAKANQLRLLDTTRGHDEGFRQFLDEKKYKPGLGAYSRDS